MSKIYVLTYVSDQNPPEHWFRLSAREILLCVDDFMFDYDYDDNISPMFGFSLVTLETKESIDLDDEFEVESMTWPLDLQKFESLADKIDEKYKTSSLSAIPFPIYVCRSCFIFTYRLACPLCGCQTYDTDI